MLTVIIIIIIIIIISIFVKRHKVVTSEALTIVRRTIHCKVTIVCALKITVGLYRKFRT